MLTSFLNLVPSILKKIISVVMVHLSVASDARGKATEGEAVVAIVGILREDAAGVEVQMAAIRGIIQPS